MLHTAYISSGGGEALLFFHSCSDFHFYFNIATSTMLSSGCLEAVFALRK
ncbi:hypothetical protein BofuT4_uP122330.1 [Botrytis cinerea T4]|uniref:Uncharacterized protein n=1 Tax=Botryotinia fuckeliana (strain T4) TaxID=999810 RepID=G2YNL6_BOTF4|nr:hypothetical protein BofuT4_uP122330.1 [Botrytis cinerea T4]